MEKHTVTNIFRLGAVLVAVALTASVAHANLLQNAGFELSNDGTTAANWNEFGNAAQSGTNNTTVTVRNGIFSMQTGATATNVLAGSGAYQDVPVGLGSGPNWRVTGYLLTWINALITGPDSYGVAQLVFLDSGSNVLQITESPHYGTDANLPVNTWVPFEVDATAPAGTATVRVYVMTVGDSPVDGGNIYFDDLNLYTTAGSLTTSSVTTQSAVQVSWPTSSRTNGIAYQVQTTKSLVFSNAPIISILTNGGFEATTLAPWQNFAGSFLSKNFAHSGTQSVVQSEGGSVVGVLAQTVGPASPGQVWDLQGYGYNSSGGGIGSGGRAVIKFAWLNNSGSFVTPTGGSDPNQIGTDDSPPNAGIVAAPQLLPSTPQDTWTFMEARGTAPAGTVQIQVFCLIIPSGTTVTAYFDDLTLAQVSTNAPSQGYAAFGPLWIGNSQTNQVFDPIAATNKFYRITTP